MSYRTIRTSLLIIGVHVPQIKYKEEGFSFVIGTFYSR